MAEPAKRSARERVCITHGRNAAHATSIPCFSTGLALYIPLAATIRILDDILRAARGFVIPTFTMFDSSTDPYDHMLHYNQAMNLNAGNDLLLCKVFPLVCEALH